MPQFQALFDSLNAELPWYSKAVLAASDFICGWWMLLLVAAVAALSDQMGAKTSQATGGLFLVVVDPYSD